MIPHTRFRGVALLSLTLILSACCSHAAHPQSAPVAAATTTTAPGSFINAHALIIIRHADIDIANKKNMGSSAPLTERGMARSHELAYALKDAGITRIVTSETLRTQETAAILAKDLSITLETPFAHGGTSPAGATPADHPSKKKEAAAVISYLEQTARPDEVILLVHHHSVIPTLLDALGYKNEPLFAEDSEFDRVYVVLPDPLTHTYRVMRLRYGGTWQAK